MKAAPNLTLDDRPLFTYLPSSILGILPVSFDDCFQVQVEKATDQRLLPFLPSDGRIQQIKGPSTSAVGRPFDLPRSVPVLTSRSPHLTQQSSPIGGDAALPTSNARGTAQTAQRSHRSRRTKGEERRTKENSVQEKNRQKCLVEYEMDSQDFNRYQPHAPHRQTRAAAPAANNQDAAYSAHAHADAHADAHTRRAISAAAAASAAATALASELSVNSGSKSPWRCVPVQSLMIRCVSDARELVTCQAAKSERYT